MAANRSKGEIYVATTSGSCELSDGTVCSFTKGVTRVREGHELLRRNPEHFKPIDVHYDIEDASAEPGRKRGE